MILLIPSRIVCALCVQMCHKLEEYGCWIMRGWGKVNILIVVVRAISPNFVATWHYIASYVMKLCKGTNIIVISSRFPRVHDLWMSFSQMLTFNEDDDDEEEETEGFPLLCIVESRSLERLESQCFWALHVPGVCGSA